MWKLLTNVKLSGTKELVRTNDILWTKKLNISKYDRCRIGNREVVGFGWNGQPAYLDRFDYPFPSIRFRECTPDIMALREKERGDWRKLTTCEKKCLYRASFCQTFAEMNAPTTEWKYTIGWVLINVSIALWIYMYIHVFIQTKAPVSFSRENRIAQYYRAVDLNVAPISGIYRPPGAEPRVHGGPKNE